MNRLVLLGETHQCRCGTGILAIGSSTALHLVVVCQMWVCLR